MYREVIKYYPHPKFARQLNIPGRHHSYPFMSQGGGQSIINKILGATPDKPIKLPVEIPPIEIAQTTMDEFGNIVLKGVLVIGVSIILGRVLQAQF